MVEQVFPRVTVEELEEERKDAMFYGNPFMYDMCEFASLGLLVKSLLESGASPEHMKEEAERMLAMQAARSHECPKFHRR